MLAEASPPGSHRSPARSGSGSPRTRSRHRLFRAMLHGPMGLVTVRVHRRSTRTVVEVGERGILARVRAAPECGRANEEARLALAQSLGVPGSWVALRRGALADEGLRHPRGRSGGRRDAPTRKGARLIVVLNGRC